MVSLMENSSRFNVLKIKVIQSNKIIQLIVLKQIKLKFI